ncbi:4-carboxymuconolactone decarboxylase [Catalinimonas alkaloidigena]|uniref:carboxymuconolactone decarboxylase family protein n=1 Tax=Catalinimonas alkaloidigena TaxID=1075417 RepID=UPI0024072990|nr:carboxymuconolactone decarboxylase family protein [Catalinimonas alkaloidigena]MDF9799974.1 4-carboxymuconolactone decarboxylase [Catalinimonas alkaloidigena]
MTPIKIITLIAFIAFQLGNFSELMAQAKPGSTPTLNAKEKAIVTIAAFTAQGDLEQLQGALNSGLDAGLTINESKEVLVHLYAYCGFPRSIRGLQTMMTVVEDRQTRGIKDEVGREAAPQDEGEDKYEKGKKVLEELVGQPLDGPKKGYAAFSPIIEVFLKEHLFADIFGRDILTYTQREIATLSALLSMGGVEPMAQGHMGIALNIGITETQLEDLLSVIEENVGKAETDVGREVLSEVMSSRE